MDYVTAWTVWTEHTSYTGNCVSVEVFACVRLNGDLQSSLINKL